MPFFLHQYHFNFKILNDSLVVFDQQDFDLRFSITGSFIPENVKIIYNGASYFTTKIDAIHLVIHLQICQKK